MVNSYKIFNVMIIAQEKLIEIIRIILVQIVLQFVHNVMVLLKVIVLLVKV
jgi:hypothetical protein